jgi:hypothetical protein
MTPDAPYDDLGNVPDPADCEDFANWEEVAIGRRLIARTVIAPGVVVSTLCLGPERLGDVAMVDGEPRLYETMIIGGPCDGQTWPLATRIEARQDHGEAVLVARRA